MNPILIIVPTRNRNTQHKEFAETFLENSSASDLIFVLDQDNEKTYDRLPGVQYEIHNTQTRGLCEPLNHTAVAYADQYRYIGFMGDDSRPRTAGWDQLMLDEMQKKPLSVAYGNDLLQGEKLPTAVLMASVIIQKLGFMAPPTLKHQWSDLFWVDLGRKLGTLTYFPDIIIEHLHHSVGKSMTDQTYTDATNRLFRRHDRDAYKKYLQEQFQKDIEKLQRE
jgi:hypothetical protein